MVGSGVGATVWSGGKEAGEQGGTPAFVTPALSALAVTTRQPRRARSYAGGGSFLGSSVPPLASTYPPERSRASRPPDRPGRLSAIARSASTRSWRT